MSLSLEEQTLINFTSFIEPLILEKIERLKKYGEMPKDWLDWLCSFGEKLSEQGDRLIYPTLETKKELEAFKIFVDEFASALSLMSFIPGGVRFGGKHWESVFSGCGET